MPQSKVAYAFLAVFAVVAVACTGGAPPAPPSEVVAVRRTTVPEDPADAAWRDVSAFPAALVLQDMVEPRLLEPSTRAVEVKAITDGTRIAFRLEWADETADNQADVSRFSDACAVQLPAKSGADVPAPQMGESGRAVEITYWRAAWQAMADGREDSIKALHPGAAVDHYPYQAPPLAPGSPEQVAMAARYAPARALENRMAGPREQPVQDLIAEGPGTIRPAAETHSTGRGTRRPQGWAVTLVRPLPAWIGPAARSEVAVAVWQGAHGEAGARKMRSVWIPLAVEAAR